MGAYYEWVCKAEMDWGDGGLLCARPEGHDGHHYDETWGRWWSDPNQESPQDIRGRGRSEPESERETLGARPALVIAEILRRVGGHPRFYAGDWYAATGQRIIDHLYESGYAVRAVGPGRLPEGHSTD